MATVINNPDGGDREVVREGGSGMGTLIGAIVLVLLIILFFVYGLPALRGSRSTSSSGINVPTTSSGTSSSGTSGSASGSVSGSTNQ